MNEILKENWFSTLVGVLLMLGCIGNVGYCLLQGGDAECIQDQTGQFLAGIGLIFAKDIVPSIGTQSDKPGEGPTK